MSQAPAGGMVSNVNGQFYEGGEFMPDHGRFCGRGKNRVSMKEFDRVRAAVEAAGEFLRYDEKSGDFIVSRATINVTFRARSLATVAKWFKV